MFFDHAVSFRGNFLIGLKIEIKTLVDGLDNRLADLIHTLIGIDHVIAHRVGGCYLQKGSTHPGMVIGALFLGS